MTGTPENPELDLIFHVNGTLHEAKAAALDAVLAEDDDLRAEYDALVALRAEMQAEEIQSPGEFGLARLLREVGREGAVAAAPQAPNRTWMWQLAAAVATVALLGQSLFLRGGGVDEAGYQMAGAAPAGVLAVAFVEDATEAQIRALLQGLDLEIVAGPSALGFYDLGVMDGGDHAAAVSGLSDATTIVESVEDGTR